MLAVVKKYIENLDAKTFDEKFTDYVSSIDSHMSKLEWDYLLKYNKLDILQLDRLITQSLNQVML